MNGADDFLDKPADELAEFLLHVARADVAPEAARERALQNVVSAAVGLGVLSGSAALGSRSSLLKGTSWLVAKWVAAGAGSGLLGLAVAQGVQELATKPAPGSLSPHTRSALAELPMRPVPRRLESSTPKAEAGPAPALPAETAAIAPTVAVSREPRSTSPATDEASVVAASSASSTGPLTRELSLLERAQSALTSHSARGALLALDQYREEFPRGSLQIEAAALRVEAVGQSGDHALALRLAQSFLTSFPSSPLAARVRAISEIFAAPVQER